jgi:hypothetical protein
MQLLNVSNLINFKNIDEKNSIRWRIYSKDIKVIKFILSNASQIIAYFECNITVNLSLLLFIDVFEEFKISITKIAFKFMSALMQTNSTYCFSLKNICVRIDFIWIKYFNITYFFELYTFSIVYALSSGPFMNFISFFSMR